MTLANRTQPLPRHVRALFFLDLARRVLSANPDGSDLKTVVSEGRKLPDGLVVDIDHGYIIGPIWGIQGERRVDFRSDLDGRNMITIVPPAARSRRSSSSSIRRAASSTGRTVRDAHDAANLDVR